MPLTDIVKKKINAKSNIGNEGCRKQQELFQAKMG
jgi:hypothetical protein